MPIDFQIQDDKSVITLHDAIDIGLAAELKRVLSEALQSSHEITLDITHVKSLDVTAVQLLWSAQRSASQANIRLIVVGAMDAQVASSLRVLGIPSFLSGVENLASEGDRI